MPEPQTQLGGDRLSPEIPIVLLASAVWETPAPVNVHQVARRLAGAGHDVLFVESTGLRGPTGSDQDLARIRVRLRGWWQGLRQVAPGLHVLSPLALPTSWGGPARGLSSRWLGGQVRRALAQLGMNTPVVWAFLPSHLDLAGRLGRRLLVYHCVDHYAANPGVDGPWIQGMEARMLEAADLVFATSRELAGRLGRVRTEVQLMENVADLELFSQALGDDLPEPAALAHCRRPRLVYVGNLAAYRIDVERLLALARGLPDTELVLIGAVGLGDTRAWPPAFTTLRQLPNVTHIEAQPQAALPAFLRHCDVALIPFLDNEHTRGSLPLKLWEYVAAGLPVVATDLPNLRQLDEPSPVRLAAGTGEFLAAVREALKEPREGRPQQATLARGHGWTERMEALCTAVARALEEAPSRAAGPGSG